MGVPLAREDAGGTACRMRARMVSCVLGPCVQSQESPRIEVHGVSTWAAFSRVSIWAESIAWG